jgi:putative membrane protein
MRLLIKWAVSAAAVALAVFFVPGINVGSNGWIAVIVMAAVLGVVNTVIRPFLQLISCGLILVTFGLFTLVINAGTLLLAASISQSWFNVDFTIDGFWPAFWGAIVISLATVIISAILPDDDNDKSAARA